MQTSCISSCAPSTGCMHVPSIAWSHACDCGESNCMRHYSAARPSWRVPGAHRTAPQCSLLAAFRVPACCCVAPEGRAHTLQLAWAPRCLRCIHSCAGDEHPPWTLEIPSPRTPPAYSQRTTYCSVAVCSFLPGVALVRMCVVAWHSLTARRMAGTLSSSRRPRLRQAKTPPPSCAPSSPRCSSSR